MTKITVSLSLSEEILSKIDLERKLVARSAYVEFLLKKFLEERKEDEL
jgi:metal-responsive CopG/Arc/MetJ family transcriptional regulator